jgi:N-acetylmuramoyl-L-alanine amidase
MKQAALALTLLATMPGGLAAQGRPELRVERADGTYSGVPVELDEGFAAVPLELFQGLGWSVSDEAGALTIAVPGEITISLRVGSAFFRWDGVVLQLANAPYAARGEPYVPLQLLTDFFPRRLPDLYEFDGPNSTLRAGDPAARGPAREPSRQTVVGDGHDGATTEPDDSAPVVDRPSSYRGARVVVIDAGHGGADPGAIGPDDIREKTIALGIASRVADILRPEKTLEIHMTRDDDTFVDLWRRGEVATEVVGDRPGIFVSIHANSFPNRRTATGFETYFLSEARTEHERRVAAIENAPLSLRGQDLQVGDQPDLEFILRELRNLDHQHWSARLAELVQEELDEFHPGPNRGVKQGVLAVLTNAVMPSVLVEVGYLSNDNEGRLLGEASFHQDSAEAIARAVLRFFEQYPPGSEFGGSGP